MSGGAGRAVSHWIDGRPVHGTSQRSAPVRNPAVGSVETNVPLGSPNDVDHAVGAARRAFDTWRDTSVSRRAQVMFGLRALLERHQDDLARLISREHGKVLDDARGEIIRGREVVDYACGVAELLKGQYSDQVSTGVDTTTYRQPLGVCVGITPFNFPIMVPLWMHPIAIACGNTFVLKPSERVPSVSVRVAELYAEAGLPDGVFNVVNGDHVTVDALIGHPGVAAVSFVGSTPVARAVHAQASVNGKRVQALGGAKNHAVVMPDADLDQTAREITAAAYGSTGQRCMALSAVIAVGGIGDELVKRLRTAAEAVRVGPADDPRSDIGPLITSDARERISAHVSRAETGGAEIVTDGRGIVVDKYENGYYLGPCLLDRVTPDMEVYTDEVFGPVLVVLRVADLDAAMDLVNRSSFGNGVAVFTSSGAVARKFQREVDIGMVGINVPIPIPMAFHSFGGRKNSLFGDMHVHGPEGVLFYTRAKTITSRWPDVELSAALPNLNFPTAT